LCSDFIPGRANPKMATVNVIEQCGENGLGIESWQAAPDDLASIAD
jgi:hypothetical protein